MKGVVAGVRDYGNRMGIPTVNGAVCFDERYLANPLVYCGTVGLIPIDRCHKAARDGDLIVAVGGRTGRDGIHGATFSSIELTADSEQVSGGAVQIGNAIAEKKLLDVLMQARDLNLYHAITDCGAGGFSSAVGEMGEKLGAAVHLEKAPLKYAGLSYTEIWISESQERMVLAGRAAGQVGPARTPVRQRKRRGAGDRPFRENGPAAPVLRGRAGGGPVDGFFAPRPAGGGAPGDVAGAGAVGQRPADGAAARREFHGGAAQNPWFAQRLQQGMDHPPVRSRGAGRQRDQAARGRAQRRPRRRGGADAGARFLARPGRRLRHQPALRRPGPLRDGRGGDRRGRAQRRGRRRRPGAGRAPRQFLLGQHGPARGARLAGAGGGGVPRHRSGIQHAVHQRQGQPQERVPLRRPPHRHPADAAH